MTNSIMNEELREALAKNDKYEVLEAGFLPDVKSDGYLLRHKKTGASVVLMPNDDDNKVFFIGFRTPPEDSTGVAHIIEHTVLCGSDKYPVKEPFVELAKGSLNTFLNAMTYPDKTMYPVASCNDKDFANLMDVYLDAVFYPRIYDNEKIFLQEGWHYEMENPDEPLTINGVVYNEMKGAFSSPDDVLGRMMFNSLYPDTTYGKESGGDPEHIPDLTYEDYLDFHRRYYHPSNSYIYLYGDMDMTERLEYLDREYLSAFDALEIDSSIKLQKPFSETAVIKEHYPISQGESEKDKTYLTYNFSLGSNTDEMLYAAFEVLDYAICSAPGAPLREALINAGIGKDVYSEYENGILQPVFSIVARETEAERLDDFISTVESVFRDLADKGLEEEALLAAINYYEFKFREADYGGYPKGLMYGLVVMDSWIYSEDRPFRHLEAGHVYAKMRRLVEEHTGFFNGLIKKYLIDNTHRSIVVLSPKKGMDAERDEKLASRLKAVKDKMSAEEIDAVIEMAAALSEYQDTPDDPEELAKLPMLGREDIKRQAVEPVTAERDIQGVKVLHHDIFSNGITYIKILFDIKDLPERYYKYLGLYRSIMGLLSTEHYGYGQLFNKVYLETGGINIGVPIFPVYNGDDDDYRIFVECSTKVLSGNCGKALELMGEILFNTVFDDDKRMRELLEEALSKTVSSMMVQGHSIAVNRAASHISTMGLITENLGGIPYLRLLEEICGDYEAHSAELKRELKELSKVLYRKERMIIDVTCPSEAYGELESAMDGFLKNTSTGTEFAEGPYAPAPVRSNEGLMFASQVQYVAASGNFVKKGLKYTGALRVLKTIMSYDYLWINIRVKGGAYGCMNGFNRKGDSFFVSYRDPNLSETLEVFKAAAEYIASYEPDEDTLTRFVIGTISTMDVPMTPRAKGQFSMNFYLSGLTQEEFQRERDEVIDVTADDIRSLSKYLDAFMLEPVVCVCGGEAKISEASGLFDTVEHLFN